MNRQNIFWPSIMGAFFFLFILFVPTSLTTTQQHFLAIFGLVVFNWLLNPLPLFVTGIIGVCLSVFFGISDANTALSAFASPIIFLFLAGFLLAKAMQNLQLDRRISLEILSLPYIKGSLLKMSFSIFALTGFFSMWISNTATVAMMLPILVGVINGLELKDKGFISLLLLGMAYSASIGGLATPVGSTPNIIAIEFLEELHVMNLTFFDWMKMGAPLSIIFILVFSFYVYLKLPKQEQFFKTDFIEREKAALPNISREEIYLITIFALTVLLWFAPGIFPALLGKQNFIARFALEKLNPGVSGIFMACLLFIFPLMKDQKLLCSKDLESVDWGTLLLFGSGMCLGKLLFATGLAKIFGQSMIVGIQGSPYFVILLVLSFFTIFFTEIASNTASANILIPIVIATCRELNISPLAPTIVVAFACTLAFMLPVSTPPNAIVFGSGKVQMRDMIKIGFALNIIFGALLATYFYFYF